MLTVPWFHHPWSQSLDIIPPSPRRNPTVHQTVTRAPLSSPIHEHRRVRVEPVLGSQSLDIIPSTSASPRRDPTVHQPLPSSIYEHPPPGSNRTSAGCMGDDVETRGPIPMWRSIAKDKDFVPRHRLAPKDPPFGLHLCLMSLHRYQVDL